MQDIDFEKLAKYLDESVNQRFQPRTLDWGQLDVGMKVGIEPASPPRERFVGAVVRVDDEVVVIADVTAESTNETFLAKTFTREEVEYIVTFAPLTDENPA